MVESDNVDKRLLAMMTIHDYFIQLSHQQTTIHSLFPIIHSSQVLFPSISYSQHLVEDDNTLDIYDSLPSIVRALSTSIKQLVYTSHTQIVAYALSFIYHAIQQGLLYAVDCIDLVVYHLPSSTRTVDLSFII